MQQQLNTRFVILRHASELNTPTQLRQATAHSVTAGHSGRHCAPPLPWTRARPSACSFLRMIIHLGVSTFIVTALFDSTVVAALLLPLCRGVGFGRSWIVYCAQRNAIARWR